MPTASRPFRDDDRHRHRARRRRHRERSPPPIGTRSRGGTPLVSHAFLRALHETGCASRATGWTPCYLTAVARGVLAGAMPLYAKAHSYGEYVFDWAWADAYRRYGRRYYPKLVAAIPFTPGGGHAALRRRRRRA